ncbi:UNVERIFIED_CONTAM: ftsH [Trichonephila clavipes]
MATRITNQKLSKSSRAWMREHLDDPFVKKAQKEGYRARAAYKLLEIQEKYKMIKPGMTVVDLGAAPGSWSQIAGKLVGSNGLVIASDILPMDALPDVTFLQGDFREEEVFEKLLNILNGRQVDVVISDMAPNTSGNRAVDQPRQIYLCELALDFAQKVLGPNGQFIVKVFQGSGFDEFRKQVVDSFDVLKTAKPEASRARSKEVFLIGQGPLSDYFKNAVLWLIILGVLILIFSNVSDRNKPAAMKYSDFVAAVNAGQIKQVTIDGLNISGEKTNGSSFETVRPQVEDTELLPSLNKQNVVVEGTAPQRQGILMQLLIASFPVLLIILLFMFFMRNMGGGAGGKNGPMSFGKSKAKMLSEDQIKVTFTDVAGCDEAKQEVVEIVDFLKDPAKFKRLGATIPRGVLMVGPPGTGKTLLAKAIAGEAKVPFFSISGSDFVEMFVGVGASRVRDMFEQAKRHAPCIIFIDEIDAVGRHRGSGTGGGHDEREQTLNQMLVEMDGFEGNEGVIVIAATNRVDVLDKALLRPGRFDRQVMVGLPDIRGREQILNVHLKKLPSVTGVDVKVLARGTPGFSGAQLANLVNEAALFAARRNKNTVDMHDFEDAKDKIYMGPERKSMVIREEERRATAYHEAGHAIVAEILPGTDPVHKVTIMPRGWALGVTWQLPEQDQTSHYKDKMLNELSILFGGRIAEEVFINQMSTGASNDFERATKMARAMVTKYGMSERLGVMVYEDENQNGFFGNVGSRTISEATQQKVDEEVRRILDQQYKVARDILENNQDIAHAMVKALMEWETIDRDQIRDIMEGREPRPPKVYVAENPVAAFEPPKDGPSTPPPLPAMG